MVEATTTADAPLVVDLDGSLVAGDTLWEGVLALLRRRPGEALVLPGWLLRGRAGFKARVAEAGVDAAGLRYREELLDLLRQQRRTGRRIILATAADRRVGQAVADHLGLFDEVIATDGTTNNKGVAKLAAIRARLGEQPFDYIGDADCDEPVLRAARKCSLVAPSARLRRRLVDRSPEVFCPRSTMGTLWAILRAMRPHQWAKNLLLAVPMLVGHRLDDPWRWGALAVGFVAFSLAASSAYLVNDLFDLHDDRQHPSKRRRPIAAGEVSIPLAVALAGGLMAAAFALSGWALHTAFVGLLVLYALSTLAYSLQLKRIAIIDVLVLAGLYTLRLLAGGVATDVFPSFWLLTFSVFIFLSLAFGKRCDELRSRAFTADGGDGGLEARGYRREDAELVLALGPTSGYLAVLVFCFYIQSEAVRVLYAQPELLWLLCPLLLYWVTRFWLKAHRGALRDDPVLFALKDPPTYAVALIAAGVLVAAS